MRYAHATRTAISEQRTAISEQRSAISYLCATRTLLEVPKADH
ncbi:MULTISPECIES: hypothetical protein [unclassified Moorena]|nr:MULTISPECIES: hypothetical protein [unclassified Moorena]